MMAAAEVLLIEDEEIDRQIVQELLALRGRGRVRVTEASGFEHAVQLLRSRKFDLVLLDTKLREISALSALRAVGEEAPDTPILPHTAFITVPLRQAARRRGPFDVAVRGDLNPMWSAVSNLLSLEGTPNRGAPAA
jgi:DNA-binding NtrC family response regulator